MEGKSENALNGWQLYMLMTAIALAAFMISLDGFIVNVAIPTIAGELGVRNDMGSWIITLFSMASTACVPLAGVLSRRFGDYQVFLFGLIFFTLFSLLSGLSGSFSLLLFNRTFQGASAGLLTPISLALIINNFPVAKRSVAIGFWSFFVMVGPAMGPMIGGWLSDYRWPWMFFINIPIAIFSLVTVSTLLKGKKEGLEKAPFDFLGMALLFICVGTIQSATNRWNIDDWFASPIIVTLFIIAGICFILFVIWEIFHPNPFLQLSLLKNRNFFLASLTTSIAMGLLFSSFVLDSLWVQEVLGYTPAWAGLTLAPVGIFPLIFYPLLGRFVALLDLRIWVIGSFFLYAATFFWLSNLTTYTPFYQLAMPRLIQGIGFAIFTIPNSIIVVQGVKPERMASVISFFSFMRMLFVGIGVALAITLWFFRQAYYQTYLTARTFASNPLWINLKRPFTELTHSELKGTALSNQVLNQEASTLALADIYYLYAWIFVCLSLVVLFYKIKKNAIIPKQQ